jgi:hypothetical protein
MSPPMIQVRVVVHSSLHSQNLVLNDVMNQECDLPLLSYLPNKVFMATLRMGRDYITDNTQVGQSARIARARENKMLDSTVAIGDLHLCSMSRSTGHLLRVMSLLWRSLICGDGEPDLSWANPAASIPLRVHSFASILHLVGTTSLYLAKNGVTQVDGTSKWNFVLLGRVLALLFDEKKLFGKQAVEKFDDTYWYSAEVLRPTGGSPPSKKSPPKRRGHVRQTYELGNDIAPRAASSSSVSNFPSTAGDLATLRNPRRTETTGTPRSIEIEFGTTQDVEDKVRPKPDVKLDTKSDFQRFLRAATVSSDEEVDVNLKSEGERNRSGVESAGPTMALIQAYGGISAGSNRRYMTVPATTLSTILEQGDDAFRFAESNETQITQGGKISPSSDVLQHSDDGDWVTSLSKRSTRQMRRPRVTKGGSLNNEAEKQLAPKEAQNAATPRTGLVPTSEDEVKTMGDAFLDIWSLGTRCVCVFSSVLWEYFHNDVPG